MEGRHLQNNQQERKDERKESVGRWTGRQAAHVLLRTVVTKNNNIHLSCRVKVVKIVEEFHSLNHTSSSGYQLWVNLMFSPYWSKTPVSAVNTAFFMVKIAQGRTTHCTWNVDFGALAKGCKFRPEPFVGYSQ
jgi:hypothetical protein